MCTPPTVKAPGDIRIFLLSPPVSVAATGPFKRREGPLQMSMILILSTVTVPCLGSFLCHFMQHAACTQWHHPHTLRQVLVAYCSSPRGPDQYSFLFFFLQAKVKITLCYLSEWLFRPVHMCVSGQLSHLCLAYFPSVRARLPQTDLSPAVHSTAYLQILPR